MHIVVIGNGVAGMNAALEVRRRHSKWPITLISEESDHFFSRTALMWIFSGQLSHRDTEPLERDVYKRLNFTRVRARAVGIDTEGKAVKMAGDLADVSYDRLLVACGSRPRPAPFWSGYGELAGIGHFVTHQDLAWYESEVHGGPSLAGGAPNAEAHLAASTPDSPYQPREVAAVKRGSAAKEVAVIGGGLIGIEAVEVAHAAGLKPHFLIREEWFWPMALSKEESTWIAARMAEHGVQIHLETEVQSFKGEDGVLTCVKTSGGDIPVDAVVIAIGVIPNTEWLGDTLERDKFGGIVITPGFATSAPDVFAAGDCASVVWFNGVQRPEQLWYTGRDQGKQVGLALCGDEVAYKRGTFYNSAKLFDIEWTQAGLVGFKVEDEEELYFEESGTVRSTTRIVSRRGEVIGFNLLGRRYDHTVLMRWINERRSPDWVLDHLSDAAFDTEFVPAMAVPAGAR